MIASASHMPTARKVASLGERCETIETPSTSAPIFPYVSRSPAGRSLGESGAKLGEIRTRIGP